VLQAVACGIGVILPHLLPSPATLPGLDAILASLPEPVITPLPTLEHTLGLSASVDAGAAWTAATTAPLATISSASATCIPNSCTTSRNRSGVFSATLPAASAALPGTRQSHGATSTLDVAGGPWPPPAGSGLASTASAEEWLELLRRPREPLRSGRGTAAALRVLAAVLAHEKMAVWEDQEQVVPPAGFRCAPGALVKPGHLPTDAM
jgi:hypothetical protein